MRMPQKTGCESEANPSLRLDQVKAQLRAASAALDQVPAVVCLWRTLPGWPIDYISAGIRHFGYEPDELAAGKNSWLGLIYPNDVARVEAEVLWHGRLETRVFPLFFRLRTANGGCRHVEASLTLVRTAQGRIAGYQSMIQDVSEREALKAQLSEGRNLFEALANATHDAVLLLDQAGQILHFNPVAEELFGLPVPAIKGKVFHEFLVPKRIARRILRAWEKFSTAGEETQSNRALRLPLRQENGREFRAETILWPIRLKQRWHAVVVVRAVADSGMAGGRLRAANRQLQHALRERVAGLRLEQEERKRLQATQQILTVELQKALEQTKALRGKISLCSVCHKVQDAAGAWQPMETFLKQHTGARLSHSLCPECMHQSFPGTPVPPHRRPRRQSTPGHASTVPVL